jgi:D-arabinose 1-dehydrogenase-like Zn-dependent alcohol dehydrogenase
MEVRVTIWEKLATEWNIKDKIAAIAKEVTLEELNNTYFDNILQGKIMGRIVVNLINL